MFSYATNLIWDSSFVYERYYNTTIDRNFIALTLYNLNSAGH
jgi:hypothetical protein